MNPSYYWIPAFAGYDGEKWGMTGRNSDAGYSWIKVIPIGIEFFNQADFPGSIPLFQSPLAFDGVFDIVKLFEIDQPVDLVFFCKAFHRFQAMLRHAANEIVGYADVKRAADAISKYVDVEAACLHRSALWNTGSPGQAGR